MSGVNVSKMMQMFQGQASTSPPPPPPHALKAHPLGRGGKLPQGNGTAHQHSNQKHSKPFGAGPTYPLQPSKTSSSSGSSSASGGASGGVPQYDVVGPSPSNTSPVRNISPPSKYPPLFPPPSSVPPPSYSAPPPPSSSSKPSKPVVSHKPVRFKSKVPEADGGLTQVSYSAEEVGPLHDGSDSIDCPKSRDDSEISSSSSGMSSSNKQKFSPSAGKRFLANLGAEGFSKVGEAGTKIAQVFKKKGAESDKKQTSASTDEDFSADSGEGGVSSKKMEKSGKRVPVKIFGNKKEGPDQIDLAVKSDSHASGQTPPMSKSSRSHLTQYDSVSVKPTRPMEKIVSTHDTNHAQATPTPTHPYKVTVIRDKGPLSPPPMKTAPPEYAAIQRPHPSKHAHSSLSPPPSLPPQYGDDALMDDEDERVGVAPLHPKRPDKRNAYENICFTGTCMYMYMTVLNANNYFMIAHTCVYVYKLTLYGYKNFMGYLLILQILWVIFYL